MHGTSWGVIVLSPYDYSADGDRSMVPTCLEGLSLRRLNLRPLPTGCRNCFIEAHFHMPMRGVYNMGRGAWVWAWGNGE